MVKVTPCCLYLQLPVGQLYVWSAAAAIVNNTIIFVSLICKSNQILYSPSTLLSCVPPQSISSQSASSYSCMLPPSPSAPRSFDSSAYSSPHLQTPPSANSNTGELSVVDVSLLDRSQTLVWCHCIELNWLCTARQPQTVQMTLFPVSLSQSGLISPGVSVPVQVPGTEQQSMSQNLGQYWARLQWATDSHLQQARTKEEGKKRACKKIK